MTAVGGVEQVSQTAPGAIGPRVPFTGGPAVDTDPPGTANVPRSSQPHLPPGNGTVDYGLAQSALLTMRRNVGVDYGRIAALMVLIDSELARAARDARVMQIEAVTRQLHAVADDLRKSATLALAGGVVSSGMQMISAGISIGGGVKGMTLTRAPSAANAPSPNAAGTPPAPATTATTPATPASASPAPSPPPPASPSPGSMAPGSPAPGSPTSGSPTSGSPASGSPAPSSPTTTGPAPTTPADTAAQPAPTGPQTQTDATAVELTDAQQLARLAGMDHTVSQLLSARSQNVVLISQGLSMLASSSGEFIKTVLEHEARQTEADIKEDEARVEEQRSYMDNTKAFGDSMQKSAHDMLQILQQIQEGLHQTSRNIWSRA